MSAGRRLYPGPAVFATFSPVYCLINREVKNYYAKVESAFAFPGDFVRACSTSAVCKPSRSRDYQLHRRLGLHRRPGTESEVGGLGLARARPAPTNSKWQSGSTAHSRCVSSHGRKQCTQVNFTKPIEHAGGAGSRTRRY